MPLLIEKITQTYPPRQAHPRWIRRTARLLLFSFGFTLVGEPLLGLVDLAGGTRPSWSQWTDPTSAQRIWRRFDPISDSLEQLTRRALFPKMPGAEKGKPAVWEVEQASMQLALLRSQINELLQLRDEPAVIGPQLDNPNPDRILDPASKLVLIENYFDALIKLSLLHHALRMKQWDDAGWTSSMALEISDRMKTNIGELFRQTQSGRVMGPFGIPIQKFSARPIAIRVTADGEPLWSIYPTQEYLRRLQLAQIRPEPGTADGRNRLFTLIQYLTVRQLQENQIQLAILATGSNLPIRHHVNLPESLSKKFRAEGLPLLIGQETEIIAQQELKQALIQTPLPPLSIDRFWDEWFDRVQTRLDQVASEARASDEGFMLDQALPPSEQVFTPSIRDEFQAIKTPQTLRDSLLLDVTNSELMTGNLDRDELALYLQNLVKVSIRKNLFSRFLVLSESLRKSYQVDGEDEDASTDEPIPGFETIQPAPLCHASTLLFLTLSDDWSPLAEAHAQTVIQRLGQSYFKKWATQVLETQTKLKGENRRASWMEMIIHDSRLLRLTLDEFIRTQNRILPQTLFTVLSERIASRGVSDLSQNWIGKVLQSPGYLEAQKRYHSIVEEEARTQYQIEPSLYLYLPDRKQFPGLKLINPALLLNEIHLRNQLPQPDIVEGIDSDEAKTFSEQLRKRKEARFKEFLIFGSEMGFHRAHSHLPALGEPRPDWMKDPALSRLLPSEDQQKAYQRAVSRELLGLHPVLNAEVQIRPAGSLTAKKVRLYEALGLLDVGAQTSPSEEQFKLASQLADQALPQIQASIDASIQQTSAAKEFEDLADLTQLALIGAELLVQFPRFGGKYRTVQDQIQQPGFTGYFYTSFIQPYVLWGSLGMMALFLIKGISKRVGRKMMPWLFPGVEAAYTATLSHDKPMLYLMLADVLAMGSQYLKTRKMESIVTELGNTAVTQALGSTPFVRPAASGEEARRTKELAREAKTSFWMTTGMLGGFGLLLLSAKGYQLTKRRQLYQQLNGGAR